MIRFQLLFLLAFLFQNCTPEQTENTAPALDILDQTVVAKAGVKFTPIDEKIFQKQLLSSERMLSTKRLCNSSEGYQNNVWEGLNDCSWAVEKEKIEQTQGVRRQEDNLILEVPSGAMLLEHVDHQTKGVQYVQFNTYLPKKEFYVVDFMQEGSCVESKLISRTDSSNYLLKGKLVLLPDNDRFIIYTSAVGNASGCFHKIALYDWSKDGLEKQWELPFPKHKIQDLFIDPSGNLSVHLAATIKALNQHHFLQIEL